MLAFPTLLAAIYSPSNTLNFDSTDVTGIANGDSLATVNADMHTYGYPLSFTVSSGFSVQGGIPDRVEAFIETTTGNLPSSTFVIDFAVDVDYVSLVLLLGGGKNVVVTAYSESSTSLTRVPVKHVDAVLPGTVTLSDLGGVGSVEIAQDGVTGGFTLGIDSVTWQSE